MAKTVTVTKRRRPRNDGLDFDRRALAVLYQNRMANSHQLYTLLGPFTTGTGDQERQDHNFPATRLRGLRAAGLVDHMTTYFPGRTRTWYLTDTGRAAAGAFPELNDRNSPPLSLNEITAQLLAPHAHDVLQTHIAFIRDARRRGDDYGILDWAPEVYHRISDRTNDAVRADALMRYTLNTPESRDHLRAFVEVDRCTMSSEKLTSKLTAYARFYELTPIPLRLRGTTEAQGAAPAWQDYYPIFPRLLFVLTMGSTGSETTMRNRIEDLQLAGSDNARVIHMLRSVPAGAATLDDIEEHGPSGAVWSSLNNPNRPACSWSDL